MNDEELMEMERYQEIGQWEEVDTFADVLMELNPDMTEEEAWDYFQCKNS
jgi:hypothetical protein